MPNISIPLSDLLNTVERPVIFDVVRRVQDLTGISSKTQIRYYGEDAKAAQWNSTIAKNNKQHNLWPVTDNLTIEVEEDYDPNRMIATAREYSEAAYIFFDNDLDIRIKPVRSATDVVIRFKYKARDRNQAIRWRNDIRSKTAKNRDMNMHDITYSYHFPEQYLDILGEIWKMRNNVAGYGDTFEKWFYTNCTDKITQVSNLSGSKVILAITEKQVGVQGLYDFEGVPEKPEKENDEGMWSISFSYKFKYEKPIDTVFHYPVMIHQQLLQEKYRFAEPPYSLQAQWKQYTLSGKFFSFFQEDNRTVMALANRGLDIPAFDQFQPDVVPVSTMRVFTALSAISQEDKRYLFDLDDLGDFNLDTELLAFIRESEYPYMTGLFQSILQLNLYEDRYLLENNMLSVDSNLKVSATSDLNLRKTYRVRLSLVGDLTLINPAFFARIKKYPKIRDKLVSSMTLAMKNSGSSQGNGVSASSHGLGKNRPTDWELSLLGIPPHIGINKYGGSLVQTLFVVAGRIDQIPEEPTQDPVATLIKPNYI